MHFYSNDSFIAALLILNAVPNFEHGVPMYILTLSSITLSSFKRFCFKKSQSQSVYTSVIRDSVRGWWGVVWCVCV